MKTTGDLGTRATENKLSTGDSGIQPSLSKAVGMVKSQQSKGMGKGSMKLDKDCSY